MNFKKIFSLCPRVLNLNFKWLLNLSLDGDSLDESESKIERKKMY